MAGIVLAGGRAVRFGSNKALAPFRGEPLIAWSLAILRPACRAIAINGPETTAGPLGLPALPDPPGAPQGPLAGVLAGLDWAAAQGFETLMTVPCDTPFLPREMAARFISELGNAPLIAARAERPHPLCALWRVETRTALRALSRTGKHPPLSAVLESLGGIWAGFPDEKAFANLNTQAEFEAAQQVL
ncbi:MAG: molybdenum cofactor guanylyltransferase [Parvibaculaceae bacterium]|nr:molybdenum cofactor guanylyltransferase [Parvibaculaceae bacterium]